MYIMQNIKKSQDAKGFTFSIFWVKTGILAIFMTLRLYVQ